MGLSPNLVHTFFCLWKNPEIATSKSSSTRLKLKWVRDVVNVYKRSLAQVCFKVYFQVQEQAKLSIYIYIYTLPWTPANRNSRPNPTFPVCKLWMLWCKWLPSWAYAWTESCTLLLQHKEQLADVFYTEETLSCQVSLPRSLVFP